MTYCQKELKKLMRNKFVAIIGDSNQRGVYKDLLVFLTQGRLLKQRELRQKGENSLCGDGLYEMSEKTNGKTYREVRQYQTNHHLLRFYFVTRVYSDYMETVLLDLSKEPYPDVVIMNSCLWDMTRYGPQGDESYKNTLQMFFTRAEQMLPEHTLFIWLSALPVSETPKAGVLPQNLRFLGATFPTMVRFGNFYAAQVVRVYERDYLDAHYTFQNLKRLREADGVHWSAVAHRLLTNMILKHIADAWREEKPRVSALHDDLRAIEEQEMSEYSSRIDKNNNVKRKNQLHIPSLLEKRRSVRKSDCDWRVGRRIFQEQNQPLRYQPYAMPHQQHAASYSNLNSESHTSESSVHTGGESGVDCTSSLDSLKNQLKTIYDQLQAQRPQLLHGDNSQHMYAPDGGIEPSQVHNYLDPTPNQGEIVQNGTQQMQINQWMMQGIQNGYYAENWYYNIDYQQNQQHDYQAKMSRARLYQFH